jgi:hypothetical protein
MLKERDRIKKILEYNKLNQINRRELKNPQLNRMTITPEIMQHLIDENFLRCLSVDYIKVPDDDFFIWSYFPTDQEQL